ncbi:MAG: hypothetical protein ACKVPX_12660 [Myxococcaceae bacterium]
MFPFSALDLPPVSDPARSPASAAVAAALGGRMLGRWLLGHHGETERNPLNHLVQHYAAQGLREVQEAAAALARLSPVAHRSEDVSNFTANPLFPILRSMNWGNAFEAVRELSTRAGAVATAAAGLGFSVTAIRPRSPTGAVTWDDLARYAAAWVGYANHVRTALEEQVASEMR